MIAYLLQVTFCLAFFYGFYHLALRKETMFDTNRMYLLVTLTISLTLPLIKIYIDHQNAQASMPSYVLVGAYINDFSSSISTSAAKTFLWGKLIAAVYFTGVAVMSFRLFLALKQIVDIRKNGTQMVLSGHSYIISSQVKSPFSFFNTIYLPKDHSFGESELNEVIAHELAHVRARHTWDVILMELICIKLWPSPMIYLYRKSLKEVHEYVADAAVLKDTPWENYAQLLVSQQHSKLQNILSNQLIYSQLKKRLVMMNQERSGAAARYKYLGFIPVLLLALVFFSFREKPIDEISLKMLNDRIISLSIGSDQKIYSSKTEVQIEGLESFLRKQISMSNDTLLLVNVDKKLTGGYLGEIDSIGQKVKIHTVFVLDSDFSLNGDSLNIQTELGNPELQFGRDNAIGIVQSDRKLPVFPGCADVPLAEQEECGTSNLVDYILRNMVYPESVKKAGLEGNVVVKFTVGADGLVKNIQVAKALHPDADQAVVNLVKRMNAKVGKWLPAVKEGKYHDSEMYLPVKFALDNTGIAEEPYQYAEELPRFPGCEQITNVDDRKACATRNMYEFIYTNIRYPKQDRVNKIEGHCIVQFVIGVDGNLSDIEVRRSPSDAMAEEVIRIMNLMAAMPERWTPARNEGKAVPMRFTLPVKFKLQDEQKQSSVEQKYETENTATRSVLVQPNPAMESITVSIFDDTHTLKIFDIAGKQVQMHKINSMSAGNETLNISSLKPGQYVVQVISEKESLSASFTVVK